MSITTKVINKSVRKHADGRYSAQIVIINTANDSQTFYACRLSSDKVFDQRDIYEFSASAWCRVSPSEITTSLLSSTLVSYIRRTDHLLTRKVDSRTGEVRYMMYNDAVMLASLDNSSHQLKIGDRVFHTHDCYNIFKQNAAQRIISFEWLGEPGVKNFIDVSKQPELIERLQKQYDFASDMRSRHKNTRPIGGMSWAANQNDRKAFGRSKYNHRQLQRSRN